MAGFFKIYFFVLGFTLLFLKMKVSIVEIVIIISPQPIYNLYHTVEKNFCEWHCC